MKKLPEKIPERVNPRRMAELVQHYYSEEDLRKHVTAFNEAYYYWDELKYRITNEKERFDIWALMKMVRSSRLDDVPYSLIEMKYLLLPEIQYHLHESDRYLSGNIQVRNKELKPEKRYLVRSLIEESIASSILEGAVTTRRAAREMLEKKKRPRNDGERMVFNNYETLQFIKLRLKEPLTPDLILEIQRHITRDTIPDSDVGQFRENNDVKVIDPTYNTIHHISPDFVQIPGLIDELCRFVNTEDHTRFIHPIIKGIIIHFLIGYIHPFNDGNGRTARSLFYWYTLSKGYWLMEYLSISRVILKSKRKYALAYLYSEYDENDLTYFIRYHVRCMDEALQDLISYIETVQESQLKAKEIIRGQKKLTQRQAEILIEMMENQNDEYTIFQIADIFSTVYETARTDLKTLEMAELVTRIQRGKTFYYYVTDENIRKIKKNHPVRDLFQFP